MAAALHVRRLSDFGMDPVSLEPMGDPVLDQCGHTFNRSTIDRLLEERPGEPISCPISREVIDVDRLAKNLLAKEALQYCEELEGIEKQLKDELDFQKRVHLHEKKQLVLESVHELNRQKVDFDYRFRKKEEELEHEKKEREIQRQESNDLVKKVLKAWNVSKQALDVSKQALDVSNKGWNDTKQDLDMTKQALEASTKAMEDITKEVKSLRKEVKTLNSRVSNLQIENRRLHATDRRKIKNLREMTITDKLLFTFGDYVGRPDHLQVVLNRGVKRV